MQQAAVALRALDRVPESVSEVEQHAFAAHLKQWEQEADSIAAGIALVVWGWKPDVTAIAAGIV